MSGVQRSRIIRAGLLFPAAPEQLYLRLPLELLPDRIFTDTEGLGRLARLIRRLDQQDGPQYLPAGWAIAGLPPTVAAVCRLPLRPGTHTRLILTLDIVRQALIKEYGLELDEADDPAHLGRNADASISLSFHWRDLPGAYAETVLVHPQRRGDGLGTDLLNRTFGWLREAGFPLVTFRAGASADDGLYRDGGLFWARPWAEVDDSEWYHMRQQIWKSLTTDLRRNFPYAGHPFDLLLLRNGIKAPVFDSNDQPVSPAALAHRQEQRQQFRTLLRGREWQNDPRLQPLHGPHRFATAFLFWLAEQADPDTRLRIARSRHPLLGEPLRQILRQTNYMVALDLRRFVPMSLPQRAGPKPNAPGSKLQH